MRKNYKGLEKFLLQGEEQSFSVCDFWAFAFGDLLDNTYRGHLAEFIVAKALGLDTGTSRKDWSEYDIDYHGVRVEVKCSAYIQSWNLENEKYSDLRFSISPALIFDEKVSRYTGEKQRNSDVYVFCVYAEKDKADYNILDLSKWEFYIVPTAKIEESFGERKTVSLKNLVLSCGAIAVSYEEIKACVDALNSGSSVR